MDETRSGWEPIALPQDQVKIDPAPGYWTGSGKAVWAATLGSLPGFGGLWLIVALFTRNDLSRVPVWRYVFIAGPMLVTGAFLVGSIMLLCRLWAGKIVLLSATVLTTVVVLTESIRDGELGREPRAIVEMILFLLAIAALTASKSTKRWLAERKR